MYRKSKDILALVIGVLSLPFHALCAVAPALRTVIIGALLVLVVGMSLLILSHCVDNTIKSFIQKEGKHFGNTTKKR